MYNKFFLGPLNVLKDKSFWVSNTRSQDDNSFFLGDATLYPDDTVSPMPFISIEGAQSNLDQQCFVLQYNPSTGNFTGRSAHCVDEKHSVKYTTVLLQ